MIMLIICFPKVFMIACATILHSALVMSQGYCQNPTQTQHNLKSTSSQLISVVEFYMNLTFNTNSQDRNFTTTLE